jgi:hypothetical protein
MIIDMERCLSAVNEDNGDAKRVALPRPAQRWRAEPAGARPPQSGMLSRSVTDSGSSAAGVTAPPTPHHQFRLLKAYTAASLSASAIATRNCLLRFSSQGQVMSAQTAPTITTSANT